MYLGNHMLCGCVAVMNYVQSVCEGMWGAWGIENKVWHSADVLRQEVKSQQSPAMEPRAPGFCHFW